ncbi:MAG TPA: hypothetical protein VIQ81_03450 [Gammaproteobacteria bacterium]
MVKIQAVILFGCGLLFSHWLAAQTGNGNAADDATAATDKSQVRSSEDFIEEMRRVHFKNIDELVALQVPGLALSYIKREQPDYQPDQPIEWLFWEQKRIELLAFTRQWKALIERVDAQREKLNTIKVATADRNWFLTEQVRARIQLKDYEAALKQLRELLWTAPQRVPSRTLANWRRLVIEVYLNQSHLSDARMAMQRYQQDYGALAEEDGRSWLTIQAELLMQLKQYQQAADLLERANGENSSTEFQGLQLLARYKSQQLDAKQALQQADKYIQQASQMSPEQAQESSAAEDLLHYVRLLMLIETAQLDQAVSQLEQLLAKPQLQLSDSLMQIGGLQLNADSLWALYLQHGQQQANQQGLLSGDDDAWYALANNLHKKQPYTARALLAVLALQAQQQHQRQLAMQQLSDSIVADKQPLQLVKRLFTETTYISDLAAVAPAVRYQLIDYSLSQGQVKQAAALFAGLQQPPADQDQFEWSLRRARVMILSGDFQRGANALAVILESQTLQGKQVDRFLQVVFDLQSVEQHPLALSLFDALAQQVDDSRVLRELMFWRAESLHALKQYEQAAYLFLKSAIPLEKVYDHWYHTATFRAAESLLSAGLYQDARQRFMHLLAITENAARRAVIQQRLQSIRLNEVQPEV